MQTLTYGRKRPQDLDPGSVFWDALADNVTIDDAHDHDGIDSARILTSNLTRGSVAVPASGWSAQQADGSYRYTVTMPGAHTWGSCKVQVFYNGGSNDGAPLNATLVKISSTTFYLYAWTSNQAFTVHVT